MHVWHVDIVGPARTTHWTNRSRLYVAWCRHFIHWWPWQPAFFFFFFCCCCSWWWWCCCVWWKFKVSNCHDSHVAGGGCLSGAAVRRRTRDRKVAGSTPGRGAIKSTRSTRPSIPPGYVNRVPACMARVNDRGRRGAFTCVWWQATLCDPTWQVTSRSSEIGFPNEELYRHLPFGDSCRQIQSRLLSSLFVAAPNLLFPL